MIAILSDDLGRVLVRMPDHKGAEHDYVFRSMPMGIELAKVGSEDRYAVTGNGVLRCSCKSWEFSKESPHNCKHCEAVRLLRAIRDSFPPENS